jgi:hypothetical protein
VTDVLLDLSAERKLFPPIHEGRYEVDPWATGLRGEVVPGLRSAVQRAGTRLLRVGMGCWLPSQDPDPSNYADREWFTGTTMADTDDPSQFTWAHLDRNLDICRQLDLELLLCFDYMPATLARPGRKKKIPLYLRPFVPTGYQFPDGVRDAPPRDPEVFAAACVRALEHVKESGVAVRYVELWNEPDLPFFYAGTYAEYFPMYRAFATAVSAAGYRVGGPSWAGALKRDEWLDRFLRDCATEGVPLDFYSFHRYDEQVDKVVSRCREIREALDKAGLHDTEAVIDEWGYDLRKAEYFGTVGNAAFTASCLMQMPAAGIAAQTHILLVDPIPDPSLGRFHGLTRRDGDLNPIALCMETFEQFQSTPHRIPTGCDDVVLAGVDASGAAMTVLLANPDKKGSRSFRLRLTGKSGVGEIRHLTQSSFDRVGGWTTAAPVELGEHDLEIQLAPESLAVVRTQLTSP